MPVKLKAGYSKTTVGENIAALERDGFPRAAAIRSAFNHARACYFKKFPKGALPEWLAYPRTHRTFQYYLPNGSPTTSRQPNPVRELDIPDTEREEIQRDVQKSLTGRGKGLRKAAALYTDFTGHTDVKVSKVMAPAMPKEVVAIGYCDGVLYSTVRDGIPEKYIHKFKLKSRPLLCVSPDGKQLIMIGGSFDFTERGIVDR